MRNLLHSLILGAVLLLTVPSVKGSPASTSWEATDKGRAFLVRLLDPALNLLPEYRGASVYWLFHDNYLAAKVLDSGHPEIARRIRDAMNREGVQHSGKIELLFGEADVPLPFRQFELQNVRKAGDKLIRTEIVTDRVLGDWQKYADLLLLACLAEKDRAVAQRHWEAALRLWDGKGFLDAAAKEAGNYSTYKLGLALMASRTLNPRPALPEGLLTKLLSLQNDSGGWITDYDGAGHGVGLANVETTCLAILGLEEGLFRDDFNGHLDEGWSWIREHREAWRVSDGGLEVRVEPGNMWGPPNDARNTLVRPAPDPAGSLVTVSVSVENKPTNQYEQTDLVWYYNYSNMVKLGLELVDGALSIVMGREENDRTRTIAIKPAGSTSQRLRLIVDGNQVRGQFRPAETQVWQEMGHCSLPAPENGQAKVSLQWYQGPADAEHWARAKEFHVLRY